MITGSTQNRSENIIRLLKVLDSKGNQLNLFTDRFDLSADETTFKPLEALQTKVHKSIYKLVIL